MSRISDTRLRTRDAAARLVVAAGRLPHELNVDLIYAEIRQGSRTTINDELKFWKDEQARNNALVAALPAPAANAMEAQMRMLLEQLDERDPRLAATSAKLARTRAEHEAAIRELQAVSTERDAARADAGAAHAAQARGLESLRAEHAEREAALRAQIDQATTRLEGVQKRVMLQTEEARDAQRRTEATLTKVQQRNEQLVGEVQRGSADAAEPRRLAERHEKQLASAIEETRELRL
ncbi:MAG: integrase [Paraburkholderia sp.]|nr:MAG: integrase [Paraburkholderia sp.]